MELRVDRLKRELGKLELPHREQIRNYRDG